MGLQDKSSLFSIIGRIVFASVYTIAGYIYISKLARVMFGVVCVFVYTSTEMWLTQRKLARCQKLTLQERGLIDRR